MVEGRETEGMSKGREPVCLTLVWTGAGNRQGGLMKTYGLHTRREDKGKGLGG